MSGDPPWLTVARGDAPLVVSIPHAGLDIPEPFARGLRDAHGSLWLARLDADWHLDALYTPILPEGVTVVRTAISRTVIDVNRDPSGASLYPGQATTGLCPTTTFDGEALYEPGEEPDAASIAERRRLFFEPYHAALAREIARLRGSHACVVVYDAHSIRSRIPRLFDGELPHLNLGTNAGASCDPALADAVEAACAAAAPNLSRVRDGRFKGGFITRAFGRPASGVQAIQMETAIRTYADEPATPTPDTWPPALDDARAANARAALHAALDACLRFAQGARP